MNLVPTTGLIGGMTIQFAEGAWPGEIGSGVAMSDEAFDLIEPSVKSACDKWSSGHRYGVFEISVSERRELLRLLRDIETRMLSRAEEVDLVRGLANWIEAHCEVDGPVSILGY